ncbi:MAG TPA: YheC/YheD family protein [Thermaerobacter sp.]
MLKAVRIRPCSATGVLIGPDAEALIGICGRGHVPLCHGSRREVVGTWRDPAVPPGEIWLPRGVLDRLLAVPGIPYDVRWDGRELRLGPVVAVIVPQRSLEPSRDRWADWAAAYDRVRGLLFVTDRAHLDLERGRASGYYLRPDPRGGQWQWGRFPLPDAAYRRAALPPAFYEQLPQRGTRLFDTECADKWTVYRWLSARPAVAPYLPWTVPVERIEDLPALVRCRGRLMLKRREGCRGRGLLAVWGDGSAGFWVQRRDEPAPRHVAGDGELIACLRREFGHHRYLAQQAVDLPELAGRRMDLRVIMQRDARGEWRCTGGAARFGKPGHIASNFVWEGGFGCSPHRGLRLALGLDGRAARRLWDAVREAALRVCRALEAHGQFGDLGLDMAVDRSGFIWLLEVNCGLQVHRLAVFDGGAEAVRRVRQTPLLYARHLAGWPAVEP